jgi:hypothetical protein
LKIMLQMFFYIGCKSMAKPYVSSVSCGHKNSNFSLPVESIHTETTSEAVSQVLTLLNRTNSLEKLSETEKTSLQFFCQELLARAEAGEKEAQLFLGTNTPETYLSNYFVSNS